MKKEIIVSCLLLFVLFACTKNVDDAYSNVTGAQVISEANVPATVLNTFNASFGSSTEREWRHENDIFICQFNMNSQRHEAEFENDGHEDSHSVICIEAVVPQVVLDAFLSSYPTDIVYEWKLNNDNTWKAHFMRSAVKYEVTISENGDILKSEHD